MVKKCRCCFSRTKQKWMRYNLFQKNSTPKAHQLGYAGKKGKIDEKDSSKKG